MEKMKPTTCPCCDPKMKPLDEDHRNSILDKLACISNRRKKSKECADEAGTIIRQLQSQDYDVDNYVALLQSFIQNYLVIRG